MDQIPNPLEGTRKPGERRGSADEWGLARDRREGERREDERRVTSEERDPERRQGGERRIEDRRRPGSRRSGVDRRSIPERLNRVAAILLPRLLHPRAEDEPVFDDSTKSFKSGG